jgi:hypothetical protein
MLAKIDARIAGIPCLIGVTAWPNDDDGGEWTILDRRGRPAPWLERKQTEADESRIYGEIERYLAAEQRAALDDAAESRWYARYGY